MYLEDNTNEFCPVCTQKAKEALGMAKPLSQKEDMKPAGGMEVQYVLCLVQLRYSYINCSFACLFCTLSVLAV